MASQSAPAPATPVHIGPLLAQDCDALFRWFNDTQAARFDYSWRPVDAASHQKWFNSVGTDPGQVWFAIRREVHGPILGFAILRNIASVHRSAELGVRIGEEADRGQGLGKEAARVVLQFSWQVLNLNRIQVSVISGNDRALRLYTALGFRREGVLRRAQFIDGAWKDIVIMAALRPRLPAKDVV